MVKFTIKKQQEKKEKIIDIGAELRVVDANGLSFLELRLNGTTVLHLENRKGNNGHMWLFAKEAELKQMGFNVDDLGCMEVRK